MHEFRCVGVARDDAGRFVLAVFVQIVEVLLLVVLGRCRVVGAVEQGPGAVLVAVEHREQRVGIVGFVGVHRRIGCGADRYRGVGRESDQNHRNREQDDVPHRLAALVGLPRSPARSCDEGQGEKHHARVDRQPQRVDEEKVEHRAHVDRVGDDDAVDDQQDGTGDQRRVDQAAPRDGLRGAEIVDEDQRRDGQQVEDVHADRKAHQVGDQHDPARGMGLVGLLLPLEHEPHYQGGKHRREGVDLALDGREPEGVGKSVGQRSDGSGAQHGPGVGRRQLMTVARDQAAGQVGNRPEKEQDAERAGQGVHGIDGHAHILRIAEGEERGQACQHHEERRSGRVAHFEFVARGDELRAIPEARYGFHRKQIDRRRHGEYGPADDVVPAFEKSHTYLLFCFV